MLRGNKHLLYGGAGFVGGAVGALLAEVVGPGGSNASVLGSILHVALWAAIFAGVLGLALAWAGNYYAGRRWMNRRATVAALVSGAAAGALSGGIAQLIYSIDLTSPAVREFVFKPACWGLMGLLLGWRLAAKIPNLERTKALLAGAVGGFVGGLGFLIVGVVLPEFIGRMVGVGVLGMALGLAIVVVEQWFRVASLEVKWAPKETTSVSLGPQPVTIGGGDDHVYLSSLPEHAMSMVLEQGRIFVTEAASGKRTELRDGSLIRVGALEIVVHAKA